MGRRGIILFRFSGMICFLLVNGWTQNGCTQYLLCLKRNDRIKDNRNTSKFIVPPNTLR